jgi:hypothetical protein
MRTYACLIVLSLLACNNNTTPAPTPDATVLPDQSTTSMPDQSTTSMPDQSMTATGDAAMGNMVTLKLENYLAWCTVTVNNGTPDSLDSVQMLQFPQGTVVNLHGDTKSAASFFWAYWVGTAGDTTSAHDTAMTTTVTMDANKTVQACCPINGTAASCPAPN